MFSYSNIKTLDLRNFDIRNVTDKCNIFFNWASLISLKLSNLNQRLNFGNRMPRNKIIPSNLSHVTNMSYKFSNYISLKIWDLSNFETKNVNDMNNMFSNSLILSYLDLTNFIVTYNTNINNIFNGMNKLIECKVKTIKKWLKRVLYFNHFFKG